MTTVIHHEPILDINVIDLDFMPIPDLETFVFAAIDRQALSEFQDDPQRAAHQARERKLEVVGAMVDLSAYPADQRAILLGFLEFFGGGR